MQLAQRHPPLGEEMHVPIFDPREQQIVGRLDGAAQIGQQEVHSASHARLLSETRLADVLTLRHSRSQAVHVAMR